MSLAADSSFRSRASRIWRAWPYALIAFSYLATSPYHAGLNNPNEMVRVYMTRALVEHDTFSIDPVVREWGYVDDKAKREGRLYSSKAPLQSLIGVPAHAIGVPLLRTLGLPVDARHVTHVLRVFGSALFGIGFAWVLLAWSRRRAAELAAPRQLGTAVGLSLALGTMLYPFSLLFTGHLLAAVAAGGSYLCAVGLARTAVGTPRFKWLGVLCGLAAGAAPFAEYPAALVALPALLGALALTPGWLWRVQLVGWFALGGLPIFGLGLWAHQKMWGSPWATGYSFLENPAYEALHSRGFFGIELPTLDRLSAVLFSPEAGLLFFSPVLLIGLATVLARVAAPSTSRATAERGHRILAASALVAFVLELVFVSSHENWRGGWTLGPRYIIPLAPVLGVWVIEALAAPRLWSWVSALCVVSIGLTGFASALYPHLSDVYANPVASFVWPTYLRGEMSYGVGHALGLEGHAANLVHLLPLLFAAGYVATAGLGFTPSHGWLSVQRPPVERALVVAGVVGAFVTILALIPERDPLAAAKENRRLWGFWEPARSDAHETKRGGPGFMGSARRRWHQIRVERRSSDGALVRACESSFGAPCRYGDQPWQELRLEMFELAGKKERLVFLHPVAGDRVSAQIPVPPGSQRAVLHHALSDASVASTNPHPVKVRLDQGSRQLFRARVGDDFGLTAHPFTLTSTTPLSLEIRVQEDGARVYGFDVDFFESVRATP